jgi:hypothetical protein
VSLRKRSREIGLRQTSSGAQSKHVSEGHLTCQNGHLKAPKLSAHPPFNFSHQDPEPQCLPGRFLNFPGRVVVDSCSSLVSCSGKQCLLHRFRFIYRDNRVPYYQKLFQTNDSKRMWWKVSIWAKTPKNSVPFGYRAFTHGQFFNNRPTEVAGLCGPI